MNRFLSYIYEWTSDFGSSASRPLLWLLCFTILSFSLVYVTDGAAASKPDTFVGWQTIFLDDGWKGGASRAIYLAIQPIANPLGIFAAKPLLIPNCVPLALWFSIQGLISVTLVALMIFAIRRRFKIA